MQGKSRFLYSSRACFGLFHSRLILWNTVRVNSKRLRVADEIDISHNLVMSYSVIGLGKIMHKLLFPDYLYNCQHSGFDADTRNDILTRIESLLT